MPLLAGANRDEAGVVVAIRPDQYLHRSPQRYADRLTDHFGPNAAAKLSELYALEDYGKPIRAYRQITTDVALLCPTYDGLMTAAEHLPSSYLYRFDFDNFHFGRILGAPHGFELSFVFGHLGAMPTAPVFWGRKRHAEPLMNAMVQLYDSCRKVRQQQAMGFAVSSFDEKLLAFGADFEAEMMDLEINLPLEDQLDLGWAITARHFDAKQTTLPENLIAEYWPEVSDGQAQA